MKACFAMWLLVGSLAGGLAGMAKAWWEEADRADRAEARAAAAAAWAEVVATEVEMMLADEAR